MRELPKTFNFIATVISFSLILTACGSGGGDGLVLPGNTGGCDSTPVTGQLTNGQSITSRDGKATFRVTTTTAFITISVSFAVDCNTSPTGQIGRAYVLGLGDQGQNTSLEISYAGVNLGGISETTLQLGQHDSITGWNAEQNVTLNTDADTYSLTNPIPGRYAIFSLSGGGGNGDTEPPFPPTNVQLTNAQPDNGQVELRWTASAGDQGGGFVNGYRIYRGGDLIHVVSGSTLSTSYIDITAPPNTPSCYQVSAFDNAEPQPNESNRISSNPSCVNNP